MSSYLFLDDDKIRHAKFMEMSIGHVVTQAWTAQEAIEALRQNAYDVVFLDHDLNGAVYVDSFGEEETGYTVAKWIADNASLVNIGRIIIHSYNQVGAQNIYNVLAGIPRETHSFREGAFWHVQNPRNDYIDDITDKKLCCSLDNDDADRYTSMHTVDVCVFRNKQDVRYILGWRNGSRVCSRSKSR